MIAPFLFLLVLAGYLWWSGDCADKGTEQS